MAEDTEPSELEFREIGAIVAQDAELLLERWFRMVSEQKLHKHPARREDVLNDLLDTVRAIGRAMQGEGSEAVERAARTAQEHGQQRLEIGWDITDLADDYELLHCIILDRLEEQLPRGLSYREAKALTKAIGVAVRSAIDTYSRCTKERLDDQIRGQQAKLRRLALELTNAQHRERREIAKLLHDDLQQLAVAGRIKLETALRAITPARASVEEGLDVVNRLLKVSRTLTADLYPLLLEKSGLPAAVEVLADVFRERYGLAVTLDLHAPTEGNEGSIAVRRLVYDAIRELLFNVVKHARTDQAWVEFRGNDPWRIEVRDQGIGCASLAEDPPAQNDTSFGMETVRFRVEQLGGSMEAHSKPGEGTRVVLIVPVDGKLR